LGSSLPRRSDHVPKSNVAQNREQDAYMDLTRLVADAILSTAADALVATDRDGIIRVWNPSAVRIFGHHADEALGQSLGLIIPERLRARHWEGFRHVMATGASHYGEGDLLSVPGIRKDGQRISLEFTIVPLQDAQGHMQGIAAVMRDVTSRFEEIRSLQRSWRRQPQHPALGERP
jgi:PAS domain S-box-containing protein